MSHSFHEIAFTPTILDLQRRAGSRANYAAMRDRERYNHTLTFREADFIAHRDSFYMASVSESGWPYVQHRGGPAGFLKVLDERTLGFADFSGNRQYVSTGNFMHDDRVSLFFMDYPNRRRLKMLGRVRIVDSSEPDMLSRLEDADYPAQIERAFLITVEGFDWNCPAHITPRFTEAEIQPVMAENRSLQAKRASGNVAPSRGNAGDAASVALGEGALELVVSGIRQLAPRVRGYELRRPDGSDLPAAAAGSHLLVPVRLSGGEVTERHYSIASSPARRDAWEIAVLREDEGTGGSRGLHESYGIGTVLRVDPPANHFALRGNDHPALLIAGGIGITPIKSMAQALDEQGADFHLHYAGRSLADMAYRDSLQRQLGDRLRVYSKADGERLDVAAVLAAAPDAADIYVCGPKRLVAGVQAAARSLGISRDRIHLELFI